ncbi:kinetochore protein NDC80 homolog [Octopus bimaculoides]|uniref:Kinetochore protein NDC80 n=1 Tax=Octopus bimaculoides TaxID=37653 RepID=A0A0L8FTW8_OCTBM|nr:kinetochore protein NDC80 homolog [Octopus bimaculoides]|eukprot:XP_014786957.1 PREDICTED: kinetochore protein NDC80 homolog [Octopus bimaculoides]
MWRQSTSQGHKSAAPARVSKTSLSKPSASRLPSMDRLSSGTYSHNSTRFSLLGRMSFGKFSTGGKRMSYGVQRGRMELRDPRPITSKAYQQRCVKSLLEFLESYGYPHSITAKTLMSPTTKDFLKIFEFIVKHIEFKYKLPEKFDEEVPRYFRSLGYPFLISKSSMFAIGSPHTWPTLLSALVWLTELIKTGLLLNEETDSIIFQQEDFDNSSDTMLIFKHFVDSYNLFLKGSDFDALDQMLHDTFKNKYFTNESQLQKLAQESEILRKKLQECECIEDNMEDMRESKTMQEQDLTRLTNYLTELHSFKEKLDKTVEEEMKDSELLEVESESLKEQIKSLQVIFDNQEYSPVDVERMKKEEEQLESQLETLEKEDAELSQEIWNKELEIGKIQEKLNEKSKQYNRLAQKLQLIPVTAENAGGLDFEMKPGFLFDNTQEQFTDHKMHIWAVKEKITEALHSSNAEKRRYLDINERENDQCNEKEAHIVRLKTNLERLKKDYKCDKQLHEQCIEIKQQLCDKVYEELNGNKKALEICTLESDLLRGDLEKIKEQAAQEMEAHSKKEKASLEFLQKVINQVAEHKSRIKNNLETVSSEIKSHKEKALETIYTAQYS